MSNTSQHNRAGFGVVVVIATAALIVALAEWGSSRLVSEPIGDATEQIARPENVMIVLKDPPKLPAPKSRPSVWVLGNSHTYALPGIKQGDPLRTDAEA